MIERDSPIASGNVLILKYVLLEIINRLYELEATISSYSVTNVSDAFSKYDDIWQAGSLYHVSVYLCFINPLYINTIVY